MLNFDGRRIHLLTRSAVGSMTVAAAWPFVGRGAELQVLTQSLADESLAGVLLSGPTGVGKTRLTRAALAMIGNRSEWIAGFASTNAVPLGALAHLMNPSEDTGSDGLGYLWRLRQRLSTTDGESRRVIVVDDAFLLDDVSAALVYDVATAGQSFVMVTGQSGKPMPQSLQALADEGLLRHLELRPLNEPETYELVRLALAAPADGATLHWLWATSGGNPLFLRELILAGFESGALVESDGVWRWSSSDWIGCAPTATGPRLSSVLQTRFARLGTVEHDALELVALSEPVGIGLLRTLVGGELLDSLERKGFLRATKEGRRTVVRLAHPFYSEVLRCEIPTLSAEAARRRLAEALDATGGRRRNDVLVRATWSLDGGRTTTNGLLAEGAWQALEMPDYALAERLARECLDRGGAGDCQLALAQALGGQRRFEEVEEALHELAERSDDKGLCILAATTRADNLFWGLGHPQRAKETLRQAANEVGPQGDRDEVIAAQAQIALFLGTARAALDAVGPALVATHTSDRASAQSALVAGRALTLGGQLEQALEVVERGLAAEGRCSRRTPATESQLRSTRVTALTWAGRLCQARAAAADAYARVVDRRSPELVAVAAMEVGRSLLYAGQATRALQSLDEAALLLRGHHGWGLRNECGGLLAQAAAACGQTVRAEAALSGLDLGRPFLQGLGYWQLVVRAWAAHAGGESSAARRLALDAAVSAGSYGHLGLESMALHDAARLGAATEVAARLSYLASVVDGDLVRACALHAVGAAEEDGRALDDAAGVFEEMGFILFAAEASASAVRAHDRQGHRAGSAASRSRASSLAKSCDGVQGVARVGRGGRTFLTAREEEVAGLAERGLSSPEIARRLKVSVRTVDNHLHRIYSKLGITGRQALASLNRTAPR